MAIYLSWVDRLAESEAELRRLLAQDPKNIAARTHLARVLSWSGELNEAITQADAVLRDAPNHKDALLVRADALQWQGRYLAAIPMYRNVLARDDDFDARVGLSRSLLALGDRTGAVENLRQLKPANARQKRDLARLTDAIDRETRPSVEARYNYYTDSDRNRLHRYALFGSLWIDNQKYGLDYRHTDATDRTRDNRAEDVLLKVYSRLTDRFSAGAGVGFTQLADRHTSNFPAGHVRVDAKLFAGSAGVNVTREVLTDTAELIENRIRMTNVGMYGRPRSRGTPSPRRRPSRRRTPRGSHGTAGAGRPRPAGRPGCRARRPGRAGRGRAGRGARPVVAAHADRPDRGVQRAEVGRRAGVRPLVGELAGPRPGRVDAHGRRYIRSGALTPSSRARSPGRPGSPRPARAGPGAGRWPPRRPAAAPGTRRRTGGRCRPAPRGSAPPGAARAARRPPRPPAGTPRARRAGRPPARGRAARAGASGSPRSRPSSAALRSRLDDPGVRVLHVEHRVVVGAAASTGRGRGRSGCRWSSGPARSDRRPRRSPRPAPRG